MPDESRAGDAPLALDAARWGTLRQAFGTAEDVPRLVAHLERVDDAARRELWLGLWMTLLPPRGGVQEAAYAALPHVVAFAATRPAAERARALHLVAAIAVARRMPAAPPLPADLAAAYDAALARLPRLVTDVVDEPWDADTAQVLSAALAIGKGHAGFGGAALHVEPVVECPLCGGGHPAAGWHADG